MGVWAAGGRRSRRFTRDERGVSAVEFALVLPVMLVVYLGGVELSHTVTVDRKVTAAASAVGDLVAQGTIISNSEMSDIFNAAQAILAPYETTTLSMVVTSVDVTSKGDKVLWSDGFHKSPRGTGSTVTIPKGVRVEGTTLIMAEVEYKYVPALGQVLTDTIQLSETFYLRPRSVDAVERVN